MTERLNNNKVASVNRFQQLPCHSIVTLYFKTHDFFFFLMSILCSLNLLTALRP